MSQTVITSAFEQLKAQQAVTGEAVVLDGFIFANVPNLDISSPIDPNEAIPPDAQIVHRADVALTGVVNDNAVVYSVTLGTAVGDFDFNWVGLVNKTSNVVAMIVHAPVQSKVANAAGVQGNVLTRSFLMEYDGAKKQTNITTPAQTWQIDFTARLAGMDERLRVENIDVYGAGAFIGDSFLVKRSGNNYSVTAGAGYVGGLRAKLATDQALTVANKPVKVWVDTSFTGTLTSVWQVSTVVTVADTLADYEKNDVNHFVFAVAQINADGSVTDLRKNAAFLKQENNLNDVANKADARNALELKGAALLDVGSTPGTVAAGDDTRIVNALQVTKTPLAVDLNTLGSAQAAGVYFQEMNANATSVNNYPVLQAGSLLVTPSAYGCQQEYTTFSDCRKFVRGLGAPWNGVNGPWGPWREYIKSDGALFVGFDSNDATKPYLRHAESNLVIPLATAEFVNLAIAALVSSSPAALDTLNELAAALGNDPHFATTMLNALAGKQPLDNTLNNLSGKNVAQLCAFLGLVIGSNTGNVVTSGSEQPLYKSKVYPGMYNSVATNGYLAETDITPDSVSKFSALKAKNTAGKWVLEAGVGVYCPPDSSPHDTGFALVMTDNDGFTRTWVLLNNGNIVGPAGTMASQPWSDERFIKLDGATFAGFALNDVNSPYIRHKDSNAVVQLQKRNFASLGITGWKLDGSTGEIVQWGLVRDVGDDSPASLNFPTAFPHACISFKTSIRRSTKMANNQTMLSSWGDAQNNTSAIVVFQSNGNEGDARSGDIFWEARGY
jgi:hypothetical protein